MINMYMFKVIWSAHFQAWLRIHLCKFSKLNNKRSWIEKKKKSNIDCQKPANLLSSHTRCNIYPLKSIQLYNFRRPINKKTQRGCVSQNSIKSRIHKRVNTWEAGDNDVIVDSIRSAVADDHWITHQMRIHTVESCWHLLVFIYFFFFRCYGAFTLSTQK